MAFHTINMMEEATKQKYFFKKENILCTPNS